MCTDTPVEASAQATWPPVDLSLLSLACQIADIQKRAIRIETRLVAFLEANGYTADGRPAARQSAQQTLFN